MFPIIAAIIGFVLGAMAHVEAGLIVGTVLGLIAWALTGFRVSSGDNESEPVPATSPQPQIQARRASETTLDYSTLSANDVGRILALSLDVSCKMEDFSPDVHELIRAANISVKAYHEEMLALAGFAQDHSIAMHLGDSEAGKEVRRGYLDTWANVGRNGGAAGSALYQRFIQRCQEYAGAAKRMEDPDNSISRIGLAFGGYLDPSNPGNGMAQVLALTTADSIYTAHFDGTAATLRKAKLI